MGMYKSGLGNIDDGTDEEDNSGDEMMIEYSGSDSESEDSDSDADEGKAEGAEEDDEVIKAIIRENEKEHIRPPTIQCDDFIVDISFHPKEDLLAVALMTGDVALYKYSNSENTLVNTLELHTKACRDIEFNQDGKILYSTSKDKSIMLSDIESGKLHRFYDNAHDSPIYCVTVLDENLFATGDDEGTVKLWDLRERDQEKPIFKLKKNEDFISDIKTSEAQKYLLYTSGDGSLTTIDLQQRKLLMQSEEYEEELTCMGLFKQETKLVVGSTRGRLLIFNWHLFGLHSDIFPGPKTAINTLVPITENVVLTACEDGVIRATHLFPHRHLGIVGQHDLSVENLDICNDGSIIASTSHNNDIKFWNIKYFEQLENFSQKYNKGNKRRDIQNHLPSSNRQNVADFFSDLS